MRRQKQEITGPTSTNSEIEFVASRGRVKSDHASLLKRLQDLRTVAMMDAKIVSSVPRKSDVKFVVNTLLIICLTAFKLIRNHHGGNINATAMYRKAQTTYDVTS